MRNNLRRGWHRPWTWSTRTWLLAIVGAALIAPLALRWISLWQVSDVALPFDFHDVIRPDLADDQNAFNRYEQAMKLARRQFQPWSDKAVMDAIANPDSKWDDRLDDWLLDNGSALAEYRLASEMLQADGPSIQTSDFTTILTLHNNFRYLARLCEVEALRCERAGDLDTAWIWHKANFRCATHAQMPGFTVCRLVGNMIRGHACRGVARWAEQPTLTAEKLRAVRTEITTELSLRMPLTQIAKTEYILLRNTLQRPDWPNLMSAGWMTTGTGQPVLLTVKKAILWTIGEPEISMRLARQILLNNANQIDKPMYLRRNAIVSSSELLFELDPEARQISGQVAASKLKNALDSVIPQILMKSGIMEGMGHTAPVCDLDDARGLALCLLLACHEYQRTHSNFPAKLEDLVPGILDTVPLDPMHATAQPMHYRRNESGDCVVWSVGHNNVDDGGDVQVVDRRDDDCGFRINVRN